MNRARGILYGLIIAASLLCGGVWAMGHLSDARASAALASSDLDSCRAIAKRIGTLKAGSHAAASGTFDQSALQRRGEEALAQLGMPASHLVQVAPDVPRTLGQTAYKEVPTNMILKDVSLRQLVGFLLAMTDNSPLQTRALRLSGAHDAPGSAPGADVQWTAELTLAYLVYQPAAVTNVLNSTEKEEQR